MEQDLQELIRDARKELRKASGVPLTEDEESEDRRKAALDKLEGFILLKLGVRLTILLNVKVVWSEKGPAVTLDADGHAFHVRKGNDNRSYLLLSVDGDKEREIATIEASDPIFASRVLMAIDEAVYSKE